MLFPYALVALVCFGCEGVAPAAPAYRARQVVEVERRRVLREGEPLGELVSFEIRDPRGPIRFHRVLDRNGRWVGHADANGRFSRRVPFRQAGEDLGVWSLQRGCALLFGVEGEVRLSSVSVGGEPAITPPPR